MTAMRPAPSARKNATDFCRPETTMTSSLRLPAGPGVAAPMRLPAGRSALTVAVRTDVAMPSSGGT